MLDYSLCVKLKEAGFEHGKSGNCYGVHLNPLSGKVEIWEECNEFNTDIDYDSFVYIPTLSELIEACGDGFYAMDRRVNDGEIEWRCNPDDHPTMGGPADSYGKTPEEAVCRLWICLNSDTIKK